MGGAGRRCLGAGARSLSRAVRAFQRYPGTASVAVARTRSRMPRQMTTRIDRVFMCADAVGGVWQYALELAAGFAGRDIETILAVLGPAPTEHQYEEARKIPGLVLHDARLPLEWTATCEEEVQTAA